MAEARLKAIIFDLYGVLALNGWQAFKTKHFSDREDIWDEVFKLGRKVDAGQADYNDLIRFTAWQAGVSEAAVRYQLEHTLPNAELLTYIRTGLKPYYKLGVLSNASSAHVIDQIFMPEDEALFDVLVLSRHLGLVKPDVRAYHVVAERLEVLPQDCLFIDDQARHVEGARSAGMQANVFTNVGDLQKLIEELA